MDFYYLMMVIINIYHVEYIQNSYYLKFFIKYLLPNFYINGLL